MALLCWLHSENTSTMLTHLRGIIIAIIRPLPLQAFCCATHAMCCRSIGINKRLSGRRSDLSLKKAPCPSPSGLNCRQPFALYVY